MQDKKIDVILNLANAVGTAFIGMAATLVAIWRSDDLVTPFGILAYISFFLLGFVCSALYIWAFKLTA